MRELGIFDPLGGATIYDPLLAGVPDSTATLVHEEVHRALSQRTAFGVFTQMAMQRCGRFVEQDDIEALLEAQWGVQEMAATYVELCSVVAREPARIEEAIAQLPSRLAGEAPYREAYECLAQVMPLHSQLQSQQVFVQHCFALALAECSMNNDCLVRYADPAELRRAPLWPYLSAEAPDRRCERILDAVLGGRNWTQALESAARQAQASPAREDPGQVDLVAWWSHHITTTVSAVQCSHRDAHLAEAAAAAERWSMKMRSPESDPQRQTMIRPPRGYGEMRMAQQAARLTLDLRKAEELFRQATTDRLGLGLYIKMSPTFELIADINLYPLGQGPNPRLTPGARQGGLDFDWDTYSGRMNLEDLVAVLLRYPKLPHVVTFVAGSWRQWCDLSPLTGGTMGGAVFASAEVELSERTIRRSLAFLNHPSCRFLLAKRGPLYVGILFAPERPGYYALVRISGEAGLSLFGDIAEKLNLIGYEGDWSCLDHHALLIFLTYGYSA